MQNDKNEVAVEVDSEATEVPQTSEAIAGIEEMDLTALRLSQDFAAAASVKKQVLTVPVRKPNKQAFIRVHPSPDFVADFAVIELKDARDEMYLVVPSLIPHLVKEVVQRRLFTCIDKQGNVFLWPISFHSASGQLNPWSQSALDAAQHAMSGWVRVVSNQLVGAYELRAPSGNLADPIWPSMTFKDLLNKAFKGKVIASLDHPVVRQLCGEV